MNAPLCYQYLSDRGITDDTIKLHGLDLHDRVSQKITKERLGCHLPHGYIECIWVPICDPLDAVISWIARPLPTMANQPKFVCPVGSHNLAFIPQPVYKLAYGKELILTEGPLKSLAVQQTGFDCVGIKGVWGASLQNSRGLYVITAQLQAALEWRGRKVYLALDADCDTNPKVRHALFRLYFVLTVAGAEVFRLAWPLSAGKGVDDYLIHQVAGNGQSSPLDRLRALMAGAKPFIETITATGLDLDIVCTELEKVLIPGLLREQLCKPLANRLGVRTEMLRELSSRTEKAKPELSFAANYEPWPEPVDAGELFDQVKLQIGREALIEDHQRFVSGLWDFFTWVHPQMEFSPILYITAPTHECGKTSLLTVIGKMARRPLHTADASPPVVYRLSELYHPTFLMDEAQDHLKDPDFWLVMKAGHTPDAYAVRCDPNSFDPQTFDVFCPKLLAGIGRGNLQIMSRSITIEMERRNGKTSRPLKSSDPVFVEIRRKLARWALDVGDLCRFSLPESAPVKGRARDNWEALYRVAKAIGDDVAKQLLEYIPKFKDEEYDFAGYLLKSLRDLYRQYDLLIEGGHLGSEMIVTALNEDKEAPWYRGNDSKGLTREKLSSLLRRYKVKPEQHWHSDISQDVRGYFYLPPNNPGPQKPGPKKLENCLKPVFDQYLPPAQAP